MASLLVGYTNINTAVGALRGNTDKVLARMRELAAAYCAVGVFTEQVISGYPAEDLVLWRGFVEAQWHELERIRAASAGLGPVVFVLGLTVLKDDRNFNCAAVVQSGKILGLVPKEQLPTYNVFYEGRVYSAGTPGACSEFRGVPFGDLIFNFDFGKLAVEVCEDLWVPDGPLARRAAHGAELSVNISASPWRAGIVETRRQMIADRAEDNLCALIYVNQIGAQDSLVFDGGAWSCVCGDNLLEAPRWCEQIGFCEIDLEIVRKQRAASNTWDAAANELVCRDQIGAVIAGLPTTAAASISHKSEYASPAAPADFSQRDYYEELLAAMKLGLKDYFEKSGAFSCLGVAMSGGKDSALTLIVAWLYARERFAHLSPADAAAEIRKFIFAFSMPTRYNSAATRSVAAKIAKELGVTFRELSIEEAFERELRATRELLGTGVEVNRMTLQNIQARLRGMRMWNWANSSGGLWLQSGNMSEKAVGYTTIGGDLMGAYSLIGNLPKTQVIALLHHLHREHKITSLAELLPLAASAELEADQEDERDLMPFPVLDRCFELFAGEKILPLELYRQLRKEFPDNELRKLRADYQPGLLKQWVLQFVRRFAYSIYKWVQAPQAVHLGNLDLDRERALQLPAVQSLEWLRLEELAAAE